MFALVFRAERASIMRLQALPTAAADRYSRASRAISRARRTAAWHATGTAAATLLGAATATRGGQVWLAVCRVTAMLLMESVISNNATRCLAFRSARPAYVTQTSLAFATTVFLGLRDSAAKARVLTVAQRHNNACVSVITAQRPAQCPARWTQTATYAQTMASARGVMQNQGNANVFQTIMEPHVPHSAP